MDILFKKEYSFLVILSLLICMLAISSVTAADDAMNEDLTADEVSIDEVDTDASISDNVLKSENVEEIITDNEIEDNSKETLASDDEVVETPKETLASAENDEKISQVIDEEVISSPSYDKYNVHVYNVYVEEDESIYVPVYITPYTGGDTFAYDFYLRIYETQNDDIDDYLYSYNYYSYDQITYKECSVDKDLSAGDYVIKLVNYQDDSIMAFSSLHIIAEDDLEGSVIAESPSYSSYSVYVNDMSVEKGEAISVPINISPNPYTYYAYDFYLRLYDSQGNDLEHEDLYDDSSVNREDHTINYQISNTLDIGTYTIKLINYVDSKLLDNATLTVTPKTQNAMITISQSGSYYNEKYVTVKVIDRDTNSVIKNTAVTLKFSNGKSATVTTNSNGVASYKVPFDAGTYNVKAVSANKYVKGQSADLTVKILKHTGTITMKQVGKYYKDKKITVKLYDSTTKSVVKSQIVKIKFSNGKTVSVKTNSKGIATYKVNFKPGKYTATASVSNKNIAFASKKLSKIKILKVPIKIVAKKFKTSYDSGKYYKIKVINRVTKKGVKGVKLKIKIKGGKTLTRTTKAGGKITFDASKYKVGKHKVSIKVASKKYHTGKAKKSSILIKKGKASIYAPETINCLKRNENYTIYVYNNYSYRPVKNAKVTIKVYTGKKAKTYTRKTDADGAARFNTKSLKKGKHKVVVSLKANKKYKKAKAKGSVEISKKIPTDIGYYYPLHYRGFSTTIYYGGYYGYTSTYVTAVGVDVYLRDKSGHDLYGKTVKVTHSNGNSETGNSGDRIFVSGSNSGSITLSFAGDSKYLPSTYTFYL